jgi:hypothetical protein
MHIIQTILLSRIVSRGDLFLEEGVLMVVSPTTEFAQEGVCSQ